MIAPVQESSAHERTVLHKQLQDANAKLALAAEALTKANAQTAEMSRMEQVCYRMECWFEEECCVDDAQCTLLKQRGVQYTA